MVWVQVLVLVLVLVWLSCVVVELSSVKIKTENIRGWFRLGAGVRRGGVWGSEEPDTRRRRGRAGVAARSTVKASEEPRPWGDVKRGGVLNPREVEVIVQSAVGHVIRGLIVRPRYMHKGEATICPPFRTKPPESHEPSHDFREERLDLGAVNGMVGVELADSVNAIPNKAYLNGTGNVGGDAPGEFEGSKVLFWGRCVGYQD